VEAEDNAERLAPGGGERRPADPVARFIAFVGYVGIAALVVAIVLTCADILWRRVIGGAFVDTVDITKLCLVAAASWSIPYGFIRGTHVTVDLLADRFSPSAQTVLEIVVSLASAVLLAFLAWLAWQGAALRYAYGDTTLNLRIPVIYYWAIFLSGLVLAIVASLWRVATAARSGRLGHSEPFA
jgi:TRAP-type C4-dicarboxylate transport system permease small subunit